MQRMVQSQAGHDTASAQSFLTQETREHRPHRSAMHVRPMPTPFGDKCPHTQLLPVQGGTQDLCQAIHIERSQGTPQHRIHQCRNEGVVSIKEFMSIVNLSVPAWYCFYAGT